jgi:hypothetical protein
MCTKFTEIKKIKDNNISIDYKIFDKTLEPVTFFIRVIKSEKIILCSVNEDLSNPFYQLDLSDPNYENMPLSQSSIHQYAFVRGIMRIIKAISNDNLTDELSYH